MTLRLFFLERSAQVLESLIEAFKPGERQPEAAQQRHGRRGLLKQLSVNAGRFLEAPLPVVGLRQSDTRLAEHGSGVRAEERAVETMPHGEPAHERSAFGERFLPHAIRVLDPEREAARADGTL